MATLDWTGFISYTLGQQRKGKEGYQPANVNTTAHPSKRKSRLIHGDVNRTSKFGVQFSVPTSGLKSKEVVAIRQLSMVAEAVYADILGVYSDHVKDKSLYQTVYGDSPKAFSWHRACSHFCLLEGVRGLKSIAIKGQRARSLKLDSANYTCYSSCCVYWDYSHNIGGNFRFGKADKCHCEESDSATVSNMFHKHLLFMMPRDAAWHQAFLF